jgi:hypothetical protein
MSSYETYISASPRPENQHRIDPYFHIPRYAAPDLDPSGPLPEALAHNGGHNSSDDIHEHRQINHRTNMSGDENGAGPSRKRARQSDPSNGHNGASQNGYNGGHSSGSHNGHNGHAPAQAAGGPSKLPVPASIFGFDARNDLLREIATWLTNTCRGRENIEVRHTEPQATRRSALTCRLKSSLVCSCIERPHPPESSRGVYNCQESCPKRVSRNALSNA